jgi:hypothetical protein
MLSKLTDNSKVWVFQSNRFFTESETKIINQDLSIFMDEWSVHGTKIKTDFEIINNLFIVLGADETQSTVSGCSKDSMVRVVKSLGAKLNIDFFDRLSIAFKDGNDKIELLTLDKFKKGLQSDSIRQNTLVFNNLIETKAELKSNWQVEVKNSWHKMLLPIM